MSEPTDQNPSEPTDDKELSALYARGSTEQPSSALDDAILAKARKASSQQPSKVKDSYPWSSAVSIAAVLVVSVTLVMLVREEAPEPTSISSQLDVVQEEMATSEPDKQLLDKQKAEAPLAVMDNLALNKAMKKVETKEAKTKRQRSEEELIMDKRVAASPALALKQEVPAQATISPQPLAAGIAGGSVQELATEGKSCSQLTEQECFSSAACTLTRNETGKDYLCRPARDHCELLFRQSDDTRETCEAKNGCVYVPATCYCPPGVTCVCGGGEPAQCQSRED